LGIVIFEAKCLPIEPFLDYLRDTPTLVKMAEGRANEHFLSPNDLDSQGAVEMGQIFCPAHTAELGTQWVQKQAEVPIHGSITDQITATPSAL
jgi:hypothetical protein